MVFVTANVLAYELGVQAAMPLASALVALLALSAIAAYLVVENLL